MFYIVTGAEANERLLLVSLGRNYPDGSQPSVSERTRFRALARGVGVAHVFGKGEPKAKPAQLMSKHDQVGPWSFLPTLPDSSSLEAP